MADASLSDYPTSVDTFGRISDLDENTLKKSNQYKKLVNAGNYAGAKAYLNNEENADLKQCAINAEIVNKHSDAIVAIENDINNNVKSDINSLTMSQNDIVKNISDIKNKLGYEINDVTNGVRLAINDEILDIYGYGKSKVSLKRGSSSAPDSISINIPYFLYENFNNDPKETTIGYDKQLHFGGTQSFALYEACFYHQGSSFNTFSDGAKCAVSNTNWRNPDGSSKMPSEYYPFSIEGGIRTTNNIWYPFGYNKGSISVNAYFGILVAGEDMSFIVECTGIDISKIGCTCGIIKYYLG